MATPLALGASSAAAAAATVAAAAVPSVRAAIVSKLEATDAAAFRALEELERQDDAARAARLAELAALEVKWHARRKAHWARRGAAMAAAIAETSRPCPCPGLGPDPSASAGNAAPCPAALPQLWLRALTNNAVLTDCIEARDLEALEALVDVTWDFLPDLGGFVLAFTFGPNDFFENEILTKELHVPNLFAGEDSVEITRSVGSAIRWKPGKNLTRRAATRAARTKRARKATEAQPPPEESVPSFFSFFDSFVSDEATLAALDDAAAEALYERMQADAAVAFELRDKIVPNVLRWYTGEQAGQDEQDDTEGEGGEEEEEEEGEEGEEDAQ